MDLKQYEQQITFQAQEIVNTQNLLAKSESQHEQLAKELEKLKPTIPLNVGLGQSRVIGFEIANPIFQIIQEQVITLSGEIQGLKSRIEYFSTQKDVLKKDVNTLAREIATEDANREALQKAIDKDKTMLTYLEEEYNKLRQGYETLQRELLETIAKAEAKENDVKMMADDIESLEETILTSEDKLAVLSRDISSLLKVHDTLAAKAEEVALLTVDQRSLSRSGAILLYQARANPDKVAPHRSYIVLIAMLFALLGSSALFIIRRLIRES